MFLESDEIHIFWLHLHLISLYVQNCIEIKYNLSFLNHRKTGEY